MVLDKLAAIEAKATAPDEAMRVARETGIEFIRRRDKYARDAGYSYAQTRTQTWIGELLDQFADLIRQAGSERERELEGGLKHVLRCSDGSPHTCTKCEEASRILERK